MHTSNEILSKLDEIHEILVSQHRAPLSLDEAAAYLKVSKSTLYKLTSENAIPFFRPGGKKILFDKSDLDNWVRSKRVDTYAELERQAASHGSGL